MTSRNNGTEFDGYCLERFQTFREDELEKTSANCTEIAGKNLEKAQYRYNGQNNSWNHTSQQPPETTVMRDEVIKLISYIDLTTLSGDDTPDRARTLLRRAVNPLKRQCVHFPRIHCAAVCTYPARISDVLTEKKLVDPQNLVKVASVAGGFPSGQYRIETRIHEIELAVQDGANEIDTVINRSAALLGDWQIYDEIKAMRKASGESHLKTILATGELQTFENIYKASMVAMMAGSDFIKTSTGKEAINATLPASFVMCKAIQAYYEKTGYKIGFKVAGGIKTPVQALSYKVLVEKFLGQEWLTEDLFRIGASSLLDNIEEFANSRQEESILS